ncbi:MAG: DEAD/DEAH box helicase, partial [Kiritimatiellae bacterium]|nr:DEAD/DEAH box helicase [Kiritimatiellia bacterium]
AEQAALRSLERRGLAREMPAPPPTLSPAAAAAAAAGGRSVEPPPQPLFLPNLVGETAVLNFLATTVPTLRRDGWKVVLREALQTYRQSLPIVAPRVAIDPGTEPGSFRVSYVLETADGSVRLTDEEAASLPKPVRSAGRGRAAAAKPPPQDSFVMRNGSPILFDRTALESLKGILAECSTSRKQPKASPDDPLQLSSNYTHFVKASLDALASSGVTIERAPEDWLRAADIGLALRELKPAPLGEPVKSLLRPYQTVGVAWLRSLEAKAQAGILADEMGLGKTIQTLAWLSLQRVRGEKAPAIVVCPTSLVGNWEHEARHFVPDMKAIVLSGAQRREDFDKIPDADLAITSYALMRRDIEEYRKFRFSAVVLDEAQNIKNQNTQNARSVKMLDPSAARLVVTGTPIENSVSDLWSIMDFLMPGYLGHYETFKRAYEEPLLGDANSEEYQDAARRLRDKLAPFLLRRLKRQVAKDLPPKVVQIGWCRLSDEQRRVYNKILDESRMQVTGSVKSVGFEKSRMLILTVLLRLRQVCCHLALLGKENPIPDAENPSGKLDHLLDLLERAISGGHRTLVFSQFVEMLHIIRDELQKRKIPFCYLDGSSKDRMESVQRFNTDESVPVFLISLKAGGTGLNLTGADEVIHVDPWWNPAVEEQATDRAHRIGQKNTVHSVRLITSDTIEERVLQMQRRKRAIINSTVETGDEQTLSKLTWADVQKLLDIE